MNKALEYCCVAMAARKRQNMEWVVPAHVSFSWGTGGAYGYSMPQKYRATKGRQGACAKLNSGITRP